jgi:SAM-dependent methyltransferase
MITIGWNLSRHQEIFKNNAVLDLACHGGDSTQKIADCGAAEVVGIDIRSSLIDYAKKHNTRPNVSYFCNDITNYGFISPLVSQSQIITCFGVLYHLFDHFRFFQHIMQSHVKYIVFETLYGPETKNPGMFCGYESVYEDKNGWASGVDIIPFGTPNISWISQSAKIFNFEIEFIEKWYANLDFNNVLDHETNKRIVIRLFNRNFFPEKKSLDLEDIWEWNDSNLIQHI